MNLNIEGVISFDTTGSMYPCLSQVRREVEKLTNELFTNIPNFKMGLLAHGDYCDKGSTYVTREHPLSTDRQSLVNFIRNCGNTGGGDLPECYELVLHKVRQFVWTSGKSKFLVLIGDDVPHRAYEHQNELKLDWHNEVQLLAEAGVKVYTVQCLNKSYANEFYKKVSQITNGYYLQLDQFSDLANLIRAIAYQQQGTEQLNEFVSTLGPLTRNVQVNMDVLRGLVREEVEKRVAVTYKPTVAHEVADAGRFQKLDVDEDTRIDEFVRANGLIFQKGKGFYQFKKSEMIQSYKQVVVFDNETGDVYHNQTARKLVGIPIGVNAQVVPDKKQKRYEIFVQSTSLNRKLKGGTKFLYEVDRTR